MKVAIIGAGTMGRGIAQIFATNLWDVLLIDTNKEGLSRAKSYLERVLSRLVEKGKINANHAKKIINKIEFTASLEKIANSNLVIEAIVESLDKKQELLKDLEPLIPESTVITTNTSSISVTAIASVCKNPERVVGMHFFNPAPLMPLVEIVGALQTDYEYLKQVQDILDNFGKVTVIAKDTPGFIVNRIARPFYSESLKMYEEGFASIEEIDYALTSYGGFKMGPFALMDYIGNDVNYTVTKTVFDSFYGDPRYKPSVIQLRYKEAGWNGKKSGKGFYTYQAGKVAPSEFKKPQTKHCKQIVDRVLVLLFNEAIDALHLGIASEKDIDKSMTKGVNYPKGLLEWVKEYGYKKTLNHLERLQSTFGDDRYRPSILLRKYAEDLV